MSLRARLLERAERKGLDGHRHIARQRRTALILVITGLARVVIWVTLIVLYLIGVPFTKTLFASVAFVALISLYANGATDFGQVCASLAQLTAGDAHVDAEATRRITEGEFEAVEKEILRLAELQPGEEAQMLADDLCRHLKGKAP